MAPELWFFSVQKSGQEARPCGLLPHPALFLGELSIHGNILKGRGKSLDLARTLPTRSCTAKQTPPLLETIGHCTKSHSGFPGTQDHGRGRPRVLWHLRSSSLKG